MAKKTISRISSVDPSLIQGARRKESIPYLKGIVRNRFGGHRIPLLCDIIKFYHPDFFEISEIQKFATDSDTFEEFEALISFEASKVVERAISDDSKNEGAIE